MTATSDAIAGNWTIHQVLDRYPALLDELVAVSPAFNKLKNPLMRKVQSRLVTVEQAAQIGGVDIDQLLARLNQAAGVTFDAPADAPIATSAAPMTAPTEDAPSWVDVAPVTQTLDARPIMARGEEPFREIMSTARHVKPGEVFRLLVGFEPVPLYQALGKQGFSHISRQLDPELWQIDFHRDVRDVVESPSPVAAASTEGIDWDAATAEVTIDVSELVPPEPMVKILETLEQLPRGAILLVHHVRRPIHLYERLDEMGYPHQTRDLGPDSVEVRILKPPVSGEAA